MTSESGHGKGKLVLGIIAVAVVAVLAGFLGFGSSTDNSIYSAPASTDADWGKDGEPLNLLTPKTGNSIQAPAKNTVFACVTVGVPHTKLKIKLGPELGKSMTQAATPWVRDNRVIISDIVTLPGSVAVESKLEITEEGDMRRFKSNGMPNHPIGTFPIPKDSPSYKYYAALPAAGYDNAAEIPVVPYDLDALLPLNPEIAKKPSCIPNLMTGFALTGAAWHIEIAGDSKLNIFDPNAALPTDQCFGHPYEGQYHYHGYSWKCMEKGAPGKQSPLLGYAADGFGIYGPLDENGKVITNAQLDECHGRVAEVEFNGKRQEMYHYVLNNEYPYSIGCFRGTPLPGELESMNH